MKRLIFLRFMSGCATILLVAGCAEPVKPTGTDHRIITLAPSLTEMVCALGASDSLVGRSTACDYPPEPLQDVPAIGGFGRPSMEKLVALAPTLVLHADLADKALASEMDKLGIRHEHIQCKHPDDVPIVLEAIGTLIGKNEEAKVIASTLRAGLQTLREQSASLTNRPTVYIETWNDPLWTTGRGTLVSDLVNLAGGKNIGDEVREGHFQVSHEWIVSQNPDIIICCYMASNASVRDIVLKRPGWKHIKAVKNGTVYDKLNNDIILRPGPRILEGIEELRKCITP
jgi:iron complex transport system substrate-binding protein